MTFSFSNLNLSNVTAASGGGVLQPGRYVVKVKEATVSDNKAKTGKVLKVKLVCDAGVITDNLNVAHTTAEAQRIGLEQLKALLECGGHPNPNQPGDVSSLVGLKVGIIVAQDGVYEGKPQFKVKGYLKPEDVGTAGATSSVTGPTIGAADGDIPF